MSKGPVRRSQLISPFGVGSMLVARDGMSLITCGLDHWYRRESGVDDIKVDDFKIEEWRLQGQLKVSHFRLPPDYRSYRSGQNNINIEITVPFLRFPQWHFCPGCNVLEKKQLNADDKYIQCKECQKKDKKRFIVQVPFVAMCGNGHIQDFPWREWVHENHNPSCQKLITLKGTGEASLSGQLVSCECGAKRTLAGITDGDRNTTTLTSSLQSGRPFLCQGGQPWHGHEHTDGCTAPLKGTLRSAANVYYARQKNAIYIPRGKSKAVSEVVALFEKAPLMYLVGLYSHVKDKITPTLLRSQHEELLQRFSDDEVNLAFKIVTGQISGIDPADIRVAGDDPETEFKRCEFNILRTAKDESQLLIRATDHSKYEKSFGEHFSNVTLIHKLRETRALTGFTRIFSENQQTNDEIKAHMWKDLPPVSDDWLPAYVVFGEGIFLEFNNKKLEKWEKDPKVLKRLEPLIKSIADFRNERGFSPKALTPRFILLHTFAHAVMNRLVFECGYSSASLRERLYCSTNETHPMAGILIYTAAGDSEGTMGGLVRMGKAGYLEQVVRRAIEEAKWCSADPVCMEMGDYGGQGPDSCNLAACHSCALIPETACEEFNRYLDRATLVGTIENEELGFFKELTK